jgi:hypothetical protein
MSASLKRQLPPELAAIHEQVFAGYVTVEELATVEGVSVRTILRRNYPFAKQGRVRLIPIAAVREAKTRLIGNLPPVPTKRGPGRPRKIAV